MEVAEHRIELRREIERQFAEVRKRPDDGELLDGLLAAIRELEAMQAPHEGERW